ncbi:type II secretion system protein GspD [Persephonella sp.]
MDKVFKILVLVLTVQIISGCGNKKENLNKTLEKKEEIQEVEKTKEEKITYRPVIKPPPKIVKPVLKKLSPLEGKLFSFSADRVPMKVLLYAIANDTGTNLIISPDVNPDIQITANFNNTPVIDALNIITDLAGVYYEVKGNIIYIKGSKTKTFHIPYVHTNSSYKATLGGDVLGGAMQSGGSGGLGGGTATGGTGSTGGSGSSTSSISGDFSVTYENPDEINNFYDQIEEGIENILFGTNDSETENISGSLAQSSFTLNKFTGTLVVTAPKDKMKKIEKFLRNIKKEIKKQVLIEAKIVEVTLSSGYQYGINWSALLRNISGASVTMQQTLALDNSVGEVIVSGLDFNAVINALSVVGKIETLSNPRIRVINGQTALISSGVIVPYWEKQISTIGTTAISQSIVYIRRSVLSGILLGVTPYIENDQITINIVPVSTKIEKTKQLVDNNTVVAEAPILNIKEAGTIIKAKDGDLIIIGGLINTEKRDEEVGIPVISKIPLLGNLFKRKSVYTEKKELIIFLKPKIINSDSRVE